MQNKCVLSKSLFSFATFNTIKTSFYRFYSNIIDSCEFSVCTFPLLYIHAFNHKFQSKSLLYFILIEFNNSISSRFYIWKNKKKILTHFSCFFILSPFLSRFIRFFFSRIYTNTGFTFRHQTAHTYTTVSSLKKNHTHKPNR